VPVIGQVVRIKVKLSSEVQLEQIGLKSYLKQIAKSKS